MSDFDKEAEREKLREQFAEDEKKREATERMSELLLQGATMTNTHCDTCGDPLFRYDGQTFCSTCQRAAGTESTDELTGNEEPTPDERTTNESQQIAIDDPQTTDTDGAESATTPQAHTESTHARRTPPSQSSGSTRNRTSESGSDLTETETSLARTLHRQATAAEETDDLGRTREHLAAAREAAEALGAVKEIR